MFLIVEIFSKFFGKLVIYVTQPSGYDNKMLSLIISTLFFNTSLTNQVIYVSCKCFSGTQVRIQLGAKIQAMIQVARDHISSFESIFLVIVDFRVSQLPT